MSNKWDVELLSELEEVCRKIGFEPRTEDFDGKKVLVLEYEGEFACEDCNLTVDTLEENVKAISLLFTLKSALDEKQSREVAKLLPYLNKYLSFGAFTVMEEYGFFSFSASFVVRENEDKEIILNSVGTALALGLVTTGEALEITLPLINGEATAEELMNGDSVIYQF